MKAKSLFAGLTAAFLMTTTLWGTASADSVTVTADRLNLRAEAGTASKSVGIIEEGDTLSFVSESGDWYQVKNGSKTGYVMKGYVNLNREEIAADVAANTEAFSASGKTTDRVNMRALPMTDSEIVKVVAKKAEVDIIGKCGVWYQVVYDGKTGYLMAQYLAVEVGGESTVAPGNPTVGETIYASAKAGKVTARVNLRESASTDADVVKVVDKNADVSVLGECGTWYKVSAGGKAGYISKAYVSLNSETVAPPAAGGDTLYAQAVNGTATKRVNLRKSPSTDAGIVKVLDEDDEVTVLGENSSWYKVKSGSKEGYVSKSYIRLENGQNSSGSGDAVIEEGFVSYPAARSGSVTARVNLRESASTGADVVKVLDKGEGVSVLGELNGFYQVKCGSSIGYIAKSYVSLGVTGGAGVPDSNLPADEDVKVEGETLYANQKTAKTTVKVNMRREPEGSVLHTLPQDTYVTLIGEVGGWYKVIYSSSTGYISKAYITEDLIIPEQPNGGGTAQTPDVSGKGTTAYVTGGSVNMRKGPSTDYGVVKVLDKGDEITFYSLTDGWYLIKAGDDTGYISEKYVSTTKPETAPSNPGNTGSEGTVNVGKVQLADWWTSNIQSVFARGVIATVTDVDTGLSWKVKRTGGTNHADVQPLTAADTAKMKQAYNGKWSWDRHAIWVTIDGVSYAASMNGMPHGSDSMPDNNFDGHHCIHFLNSRTHTGNRLDTAHQAAVQKAYKAGK